MLLAVPSAAIADALAAAKGVDGKVVIDATNHFQGDPAGLPSLSHQVQSITGGPVAKAFNLNFASIHDMPLRKERRPAPSTAQMTRRAT